MLKRWITSLIQRQRIAGYWRHEFERELQDRRRADHLEGKVDTAPAQVVIDACHLVLLLRRCRGVTAVLGVRVLEVHFGNAREVIAHDLYGIHSAQRQMPGVGREPHIFGIGELHHALAKGVLTRDRVHAELADVVVGRRPGRTRRDEITIFDSSGTALQDVAAAVAVYEKASASGRGTVVKLDA